MVLLDTGTPGTSREIYSEDADGETRTRNPWITNPTLAIELYSSKAIAGKELSLSSWCIASLYIYHQHDSLLIREVQYSTGHRNSWCREIYSEEMVRELPGLQTQCSSH